MRGTTPLSMEIRSTARGEKGTRWAADGGVHGDSEQRETLRCQSWLLRISAPRVTDSELTLPLHAW